VRSVSKATGALLQTTELFEPQCSACVDANGLCRKCAVRDRSILPHLAVPSWVRLIGNVTVAERQRRRTLSVHALRCKRRNERRERKRRHTGPMALIAAMGRVS
jgi:hypothetical protein